MTLVRDPLFWKRFSRAVHLDEEAKAAAQNKSPGQLDPSTVPKETTVDSMWLCHLFGSYESRGRYYCGPSVAPCPPLVTRQSR
ncbi:uncharacterized protein P174DRAFT_463795 [Aspergillus novofumigatus IBT 16806]|uniref:Uncharacterized protein n=1 Tax=Aspergillus novofumigatus (strain IBT 16806) TaxID=1392255 RepID=A0A2I1BYA1_ASPN1|nr:uncharacterized protein P174DRAFT_463795 [Aspergillus novofumigatus IBT 16806]PKX90352.1 hypothetical protein P174DRAFT_463795 [Aspergillus novofumigatus IBT 16806]